MSAKVRALAARFLNVDLERLARSLRHERSTLSAKELAVLAQLERPVSPREAAKWEAKDIQWGQICMERPVAEYFESLIPQTTGEPLPHPAKEPAK